jgi:hypothetical protein
MIRKWLDTLDRWAEKATRKDARVHSRRAFLSGFGASVIGVGAVTLLPVFRGGAFAVRSRSRPDRRKVIRTAATTGGTAPSMDTCAAAAAARSRPARREPSFRT